MSKLMLKLRDLRSGEGMAKELASVEEAITWLAARPPLIEVLGVVFEGLAREDNDRMKKAMRPLDDAEKARLEELEEAEKDEREKREEARRAEAEANARAAREAAKTADPNRPMELRYRFDKPDLEKTDVLDERAVTEEAQIAVRAFVEERMEWVAARGQTIGEAKVTVYPGPVPANSERIVGGSFVPVTAPPKGSN
jgi:hypothetical protein